MAKNEDLMNKAKAFKISKVKREVIADMLNLPNLKSVYWEVVANNIVMREPAGRI